MEAIAMDALISDGLGNGIGGGFSGHGLMEDRIKAGVVVDMWEALHGRSNQGDSLGIMKRSERDGVLQVGEDFRGDPGVISEFGAGVDDAISNRVDGRHAGSGCGIKDEVNGLPGVLGLDGMRGLSRCGAEGFELQLGLGCADPAQLAVSEALRSTVFWWGAVERNFDGRGTAVDDENSHSLAPDSIGPATNALVSVIRHWMQPPDFDC